MGGYGSGRWSWHNRRATVEESLILNINKLAKDGCFNKSITVGLLTWRYASGARKGQFISSIGYEYTKESNKITLKYRQNDTDDIVLPIRISTTHQPQGGSRYWFTCPNNYCGRRAYKLYMAPGTRYFLCRECHNLSYESCNESHKYDSLYAKIGLSMGVPIPSVSRVMRLLKKVTK